MSIDLSQFTAIFLEESYEGLEVMESSLLNLESADEERINTIFRAAHSIKGGAGTFGFSEVADFTHVVETLLDELRSGRLAISPELINLLLESVDCIKSLLEATQEGPEADAEVIQNVQLRLQQALKGDMQVPDADASADSPLPDLGTAQGDSWLIRFQPAPQLLQSGHEPAFMFAALEDFGPLKVTPQLSTLPTLADLQPQQLYLSWTLELQSDCERDEVLEIFEWVEDLCELQVSRIDSSATPPTNTAAQGWIIDFVPFPTLLETGNDPVLMFSALEELGTLQVQVGLSQLPDLRQLEPEKLYLSWTLTLESDCTQEEVAEIFEWVEDECELTISPLAAAMVQGGSQLDNAPDSEESASSAATFETTAAVDSQIEPETQAAAPVTLKADKPVVAKPTANKAKAASENSSIRVDTDKIDTLIDRVGELVITQAMLCQVGDDLAEQTAGPEVERLRAGLEQLERNTRDLQEDVMRVRMLPISFVFNRFPRLVHDVSSKLGKKVELRIKGEQTEIDKTVMEKIGDPMVHLIRNSLDHGLEPPQERLAAGKPETGSVELHAYHQGGFIIIDITDDGRGLNTEKIHKIALEKGLVSVDQALSDSEINELIFKPGFSTADAVSDLSGRGVGMDVVRRNIESLGGYVKVDSEPGHGSRFSVSLPLTLAILDGQLVRVNEQTYIIPLTSIVETILADRKLISPLAGESKLLHFRDEYIPLINLRALFRQPLIADEMDQCLIAIVENGGQKVGLIVDELDGQQQVVIKSLEVNFKRIEGFAGATILGDGSVALILDIAGLIKRGLDGDTTSTVRKRNQRLEHGMAHEGALV